MLKQSLPLIFLLIGASYSASVADSTKYSERLNDDPSCKDDNLKSIRAGLLDSTINKYQVIVDYCYNTTKGQIEGAKVYHGDNKIYEDGSFWGKLNPSFSDSIEEDFKYFMSYFTIEHEMTKFLNGKEGVPNFELIGIINVETVWNIFFARDETIKVWKHLNEEILKFSKGKGKVEVNFRFSGRPYTLTNKGESLQLFAKKPDQIPIPDSFFVTVLEGSKKYEFVILNDPSKVLYSAFKFENCKNIDWLKIVDDADSEKLLKCK